MSNYFNYLRLELQRLNRNKKYFIFTIGIPCFMYFFVTRVFFNSSSISDEQRLVFLKGYLVSMIIVSILSTILFAFPAVIIENAKDGWNRLMNKVALPKSTYLLTVWTIQCVFFISSISTLLVIVNLVDNLSFSFETIIGLFLTLMVGILFFVPLGVVFATFDKMENASMCANLVFMMFGFVGGLYVPIEGLPSWIAKITEWMPSYQFLTLVTTCVNENRINWVTIFKLSIFAGICLLLAFKLYKDKEKY